jgi:predicted neuraminidase
MSTFSVISHDVTSQRAFTLSDGKAGTTKNVAAYTNQMANAMFVAIVTFSKNTGTTNVWLLSQGGTRLPTPQLLSATSGNSEWSRTNFFIVPAGCLYEIEMDTGGSILSWIEYY